MVANSGMNHRAQALRILDASLNRASEGLRVVEDFARFVLNDEHFSSAMKQLRHDLATTGREIAPPTRSEVRDTLGDVGVVISTADESQRTDAWEVCVANLERTKQSLRSLEEYSKSTHPGLAGRFESLRYRLYTIEAAMVRTGDAIARLEGVRLYVLVGGCDSLNVFESLVRRVVEAGADAIQLRDKRLGDAELLGRARRLVEIAREVAPASKIAGERDASLPARTLAIINDRADIAAAADADGLHLGQDDLKPSDARPIVGPGKLIGVSTHSIEQARTAVLQGASYLGVGPTFPSRTKSFPSFPGQPLLTQIAAEISLPAFAIGGIAAENLSAVLATGIGRVAVSEAIVAAKDPFAAVRTMQRALAKR